MNPSGPMLQFAVVSEKTEKAVELFPSREEAEAFIAEVAVDDPELLQGSESSRSSSRRHGTSRRAE